MQDESRRKIQETIASNKKAVKSRSPKINLSQNPDLLRITQERDKLAIDRLLVHLRQQYSELVPFVGKMKSSVGDITEETHVCAIYLLLCQVFSNWNSCFFLAESGRSAAAGNLIRTIKEGVSQVELFALESAHGDRSNLAKWFSGDIIPHSKGRRKVGDYVDKYLPSSEISTVELGSQIYQIESQVSHNGYASILELVSPFTEDYDFDGYVGYYRTIAWLRYAEGSLEATNIAMKMAYSMVVKDEESFKKLNEILVKYNPGNYGDQNERSS